MDGTPEDYRNKLRPVLIESNKYHLQKLVDNKNSLEDKLRKITCRIAREKIRIGNLTNNLGRANIKDLEALHFMYFGESGKCVNPKLD